MYFHLIIVSCASNSKPHHHQGQLTKFSGKHISYNITKDDSDKLEKGEPIMFKESSGRAGKGTVIQDIDASPEIVMDHVSDLKSYTKHVQIGKI